jgi:hypothetical protein
MTPLTESVHHVEFLCYVCEKRASLIELVPPGKEPPKWLEAPKETLEFLRRHRQPESWWLVFEGVDAGNGFGSEIDENRAQVILPLVDAEPPSVGVVIAAGFYDDAGFCLECGVPYCYDHWHEGSSTRGTCPKGHAKSLDPHWSPD